MVRPNFFAGTLRLAAKKTPAANVIKQFNARRYSLPKEIIKNYNVIINGKTFMTKHLIQEENVIEKLEN